MEFAMWGFGFFVVAFSFKILVKIIKKEDQMMIERRKILFGK